MSKKSAISGVLLVAGFIGLAGKVYYDKEKAQEQLEQEQLEEIPVLPLNGVFTCNYYKGTTHQLEGISWYEVTESARGWNWTFIVEDGTAVFFTQTAGQFCYVSHVEEE